MPLVAWFVSACLLGALQSTHDGSPPIAPPAVTVVTGSVSADMPAAAHGAAKASAPELAPIHIGPILLTGYAHFDGIFPLGDHDVAHTGTFRVRRARVFASADLSPKVGFMLSADAVASSIPLDVYLALKPMNAAHIRVGQFVAPYGLERLTSAKDLEAIDRVLDPFVPARDMGVTVFSATPFWNQLLYSVAVINGTGQNTRDNNDAKDYVGRIVWRVPLTHVSIGVNGASGRQPTGRRDRWGADVNLDYGDYRVAAEYTHQAQEWGGRRGHGFYLLARRRFRPAATGRSDFGEAVVRLVEIQDANEIIGAVTGPRHREVQAGGNYYFSRNARIMADAFVPVKRLAGAARATIVTRVQFMF
jgi:Phosphate-selective porin O and P